MKLRFIIIGIFFTVFANAQNATTTNTVARPKLVVGIVIDQMRWDYLYRYYPLYASDGGFKKLLNAGYTCENTMIPYTPTVTAAGHACIYTGSVPAIHGITGNNWFDKALNKSVYCCDDDNVKTVGADNKNGWMSPRNLFTTTITDELRIATNFQSKVIGLSIKDRGAILPAGHAANAAYWYDTKTGNFITSTYYTKALPEWVQIFNARKLTDSLYKLGWNITLPQSVYAQYCTADDEPYERKVFGDSQKTFPYDFSSFVGKDYGKINATPYGNDLLAAMAKATIINEQMGKHAITDFLTVSFSSPDYVGHAFGPNSWEQLDDYIRLDKLLGNFISFLDVQIGKGNYTLFLTADHGVAHVPAFSKMNNLPGGIFNEDDVSAAINNTLKNEFGLSNLVEGVYEYNVVLNHKIIDSANLDEEKITEDIIEYLSKQEYTSQAFSTNEMDDAHLTSIQKEMMQNGYYPGRSGDIQIVLKPGYVDGNGIGTSHGVWNPYDAHIPLLWYGWGIKHGKSNHEYYMTDIAATLAALLHIQMPSGCIGHVIEDVMK